MLRRNIPRDPATPIYNVSSRYTSDNGDAEMARIRQCEFQFMLSISLAVNGSVILQLRKHQAATELPAGDLNGFTMISVMCRFPSLRYHKIADMRAEMVRANR